MSWPVPHVAAQGAQAAGQMPSEVPLHVGVTTVPPAPVPAAPVVPPRPAAPLVPAVAVVPATPVVPPRPAAAVEPATPVVPPRPAAAVVPATPVVPATAVVPPRPAAVPATPPPMPPAPVMPETPPAPVVPAPPVMPAGPPPAPATPVPPRPAPPPVPAPPDVPPLPVPPVPAPPVIGRSTPASQLELRFTPSASVASTLFPFTRVTGVVVAGSVTTWPHQRPTAVTATSLPARSSANHRVSTSRISSVRGLDGNNVCSPVRSRLAPLTRTAWISI